MKNSLRYQLPQCSLEETLAIVKIAQRYVQLTGHDTDRLSLVMDIEACHYFACALDLEGLLNAADFDLVHDVSGIWRHYDPDTHTLTGCFMPRYAAANNPEVKP